MKIVTKHYDGDGRSEWTELDPNLSRDVFALAKGWGLLPGETITVETNEITRVYKVTA